MSRRLRLTPLRAVAVIFATSACGGQGGLPPQSLPEIKGPDGRTYLLLDRGAYKGIYDVWGRLDRIEYDSNGDGRPDHIARHEGLKSPPLLEVDEDFDGRIDRWEEYDQAGRLQRVGLSRKRRGLPDLWVTQGPGDLPAKKEYDENEDQRVDRTEILQRGLLVRVELDSDGDEKVDRWQDWSTGRLSTEDLDTDRDGKPDRRITYSAKGRVLKLEPIRGE